MNISIPDPMRDWVLSRVETGAYAGASDYVRELIRRDQAAARERGLAELDAAVQLALADAEAGRTKPAAEVLDRLSAKYAAMAEDERRQLTSKRPSIVDHILLDGEPWPDDLVDAINDRPRGPDRSIDF